MNGDRKLEFEYIIEDIFDCGLYFKRINVFYKDGIYYFDIKQNNVDLDAWITHPDEEMIEDSIHINSVILSEEDLLTK